MSQRIYVVAGEMSGDIHGAELLAALKAEWPEAEFRGWGGPDMQAQAGPEIRNWLGEAAVMGLWEVLKRYPYFKEKFYQTLDEITAWRPDILLLIDYPGFNLRLAKKVKATLPETKIVHYVAPQVWAWNRKRVPKVAASHDLLLCLFPFEQPIFQEAGLKTIWIGHPLVDELESKRIQTTREDKLVALLPGSRSREVERLFPVMLEAAQRLLQTDPALRFEAAAANDKLMLMMERMRREIGLSEQQVTITLGGSQSLMQRASCGTVASGTATLEAAYYGLPYCLTYALAWPTYLIAQQLVKIPHIGLINILAGREVIPELVQGNANAYELTSFLHSLLVDKTKRDQLSQELLTESSKLGQSGVHHRAAEAIISLLEPSSQHT